MSGRFGTGNYPPFRSNVSRARTMRRQQLLMVTAAGTTFSIALILIFVFNFGAAPAANSEMQGIDTVKTSDLGVVTLLAPERDLREGEPLSSVRMKEIYWPRNKIPPEAVRDIREVAGMTAKAAISSAVPLVRSDLTKEYSGNALQPATGYRAMSIEVDQTSGIEGHARPGMRVDVALTYQEQGLVTTRIIVENAKILSTDGDTTQASELTRAGASVRRPSRTVSLEVTVKDALGIETARQLGRLSLMLRNAGDTTGASKTQVDANDIAGKRNGAEQHKRKTPRNRMKVEGREYYIDDEGILTEATRDEP